MTWPVEGLFCRQCDYDLGGAWRTNPAVCPECGRVFEPSDPKTMRACPKRQEWTRRLLSWAVVVVLSVFVFVAVERAWVIRPASLSTTRYFDTGIGLWEWLGKYYGWDRRTAGDVKLAYWVWGDINRPTTVIARGPDSRWRAGGSSTRGRDVELWRVERGETDWTISVSDPGTAYLAIVSGFNSTRDGLLGVRPTNQPGLKPTAAYVIRGSEDEILTELFKRYGVEVEPVLQEEGQTHVWVWSDAQEKLVRVTVEDARAQGFALDAVYPVGGAQRRGR